MATNGWIVAAVLAGASSALFACAGSAPRAPEEPLAQREADSVRSASAFTAAYAVFQSPRCLNCHPRGDRPLQGDDSHVHAQDVQRGTDGAGMYAEKCAACHGSTNVAGAHMPPGAPGWHLAPKESPLAFQGVSAHDLCRQLLDPRQNGGRSIAEVLEHVEHAPLVSWAWDPGEGRTPPPLSHDEFVRLVRTWIDGGCKCPE